MPVNSIAIQLDRVRKIYHQGEYLTGLLIIENKFELKHEGITLFVEGLVDIHFNLRSISFMDTFYGSNKTISLVEKQLKLLEAGRLSPAKREIPFKILLEGVDERTTLYESYHGVFVSIQYNIKCCIKRPFFSRDLLEAQDFCLEYDAEPIGAQPLVKKPIRFEINPDNLNAYRQDLVPDFRLTGQLDSSVCLLNEPITGEFTIEKCEATIRSVELQLVRVETCGLTPGDRDYSRDTTEVQNIQIGDGNLLRNVPIPIYMILPRLFTCPTLITSNFKLEFEINLVIIFDDNHLITENFPIKLIRATLQPINCN